MLANTNNTRNFNTPTTLGFFPNTSSTLDPYSNVKLLYSCGGVQLTPPVLYTRIRVYRAQVFTHITKNIRPNIGLFSSPSKLKAPKIRALWCILGFETPQKICRRRTARLRRPSAAPRGHLCFITYITHSLSSEWLLAQILADYIVTPTIHKTRI